MEKAMILILIVLLFFSPAYLRTETNDGMGFSLNNDEARIYLSFENCKKKDGWTPVILSLGEIECHLWMNEEGKISEFQYIGTAFDDPVCVIDMASHSLKKDGKSLYFDVYEQSNVRTRWILPPNNTAGKLAKKIFIRENGLDVCLGDMKLTFSYASGDVQEFPGFLEVQFHGTTLTAYQTLVYEKDEGIFYSVYEWKNKLITEQNEPRFKNSEMLSAIPPQERTALIALYDSTNGDMWARNDGWKTPPLAADGFALTGTEQNWYGITCNPVNSTVQKIDLSRNGLRGTLPPELGDLSNLQYLFLDENFLQGFIPPEIGNLANLKSLNMASNEIMGTLPPELGNLTKLEQLFLSMNSIGGSIPPGIGNLENLQYLSFSDNMLEGSIPSEMGNLHNLLYLNFGFNMLSGNIPPEFGDLVNLLDINLDNNQLSGQIPAELGNLVNLKSFSFSTNQLTGSITPELGNLVNLTGLYLSNNLLNGNIPPELGNLIKLRNLQMNFNQLCGSMPPEIGKLLNLQTLLLYGNQLNGSLPPELGNLTKLSLCYLFNNRLSGNLPPELGNLTNLHLLNLSSNQIRGSIPPELAKMVNLESLSLYENQLSGSIPSELGKMVNLDFLRLDGNQLSGSIPPELGKMIDLEYFNLDENQLSGSIPPELADMPRLRDLRLNGNQLSGNIPWQLGNAPRLETLWISSNKLSGDIPSSLTNLQSLQNIDFRWNALYTNDSTLRTFLERRQDVGNWESTQTIAPSDVTASVASPSSVTLHWTPIIYTADTGGYRVYYSTTPGGPYTYSGMTADKTASSLTVTGLKPGVTYYFVVQTRTYPHQYNENTVTSGYSTEASVFLSPIMLTSPNGGESWRIGTVQKITWDSLGLSGKIRIELWKAGKKVSIIAVNFPVARGSYTWLVGNNGIGIITPGSDYKIKIITGNGLYYDISDESFSIVNG